MSNEELGVYLARFIFELGSEAADIAQRLQFKGGTYPDHETDLGGLSETSLASSLAHALNMLPVGKTSSQSE